MEPTRRGQWYIVVTCKHCNQRIELYRDLSKGKSEIRQTKLRIICPNCGKEGAYQAEHYQAPDK